MDEHGGSYIGADSKEEEKRRPLSWAAAAEGHKEVVELPVD